MNCLLVFDHVNDITYSKYNKKFLDHMKDFAVTQGFINKENENAKIDGNIIVQIFSPVIASQRIMNCQFGNSYTSIQCDDDLNVCFDEFMGYLFVAIGQNEVSSLKRYLSICVTIVRYICGPDILQLRDKPSTSALVTKLINSWTFLYNNDQSVLVEAVEQLTINSDLSSSMIKALSGSVEKLMLKLECSKIHSMLIVQNKFLSLYSSPNAKELSSADIIFLMVLLHSSHTGIIASEDDSDDEFYSPVATPDSVKSVETHTFGYKVLLAGPHYNPQCLPHIVHIVPLSEGINLLYLLEVGNAAVASNIYETFCHLHTMQFVQIQRDIETMRPAVENLDIATKKLSDSLKKTKNSTIEMCYKQLIKKWEITRKKYQDFIKSSSDEALLRAETLILGFLENLKQLFSLTAIDDDLIEATRNDVLDEAQQVHEKLSCFSDFFRVKAIKNFSLGSDSLTINKYLEEFPGLVHFIYIDRTNHRITAPSLENSSDETFVLTKKKIWQMVEFSQNHLQEGNLSLMWKDTIFNYTYFLWFEDSSGAPLKPIIHPMNSTKLLPLPGLLCCDFYQKLKEVCFPKMAPSKIRCYELYCIHLGLVTASCVLEHTRRMAATIWELKGHPNHPIDLL